MYLDTPMWIDSIHIGVFRYTWGMPKVIPIVEFHYVRTGAMMLIFTYEQAFIEAEDSGLVG